MQLKKILFIFLSLLVSQACVSQQNDTDAEKSTADSVQVVMLKYEFLPKILEIKVGQKVRWINQEKRQYHSVWFEKYGEAESDYIFPGESYEKVFDKPGTFDYRCGPHPEMVGQVVVKP